MSNDKRGLFLLKGDTLYCANDGEPFNGDSVYAICQMNATTKDANADERSENQHDCEGKELIEEIQKENIDVYKRSPNRLRTDARGENAGADDQSGRWHFELLQNMDDAMGSDGYIKFIGTKGRGFRSVLEITDSPAIFSGKFQFGFCKEKTRELLKKEDIRIKKEGILKKIDKDTKIPTLQIPHDAKGDETVIKLKKDGYATVFRLPIRKGEVGGVKKNLKEFSCDFLLFPQNITMLQIRIEDKDKPYHRSFTVRHTKMGNAKDDVIIDKVTVEEGDNHDSEKHVFLRWKKEWGNEKDKMSSCMFSLPYKNKQCYALDEAKDIFNFYPTNESVGLKAFLHATFPLTSDRKRLIFWKDANKQEAHKDEKLIEEFASLIKSVLTCKPNSTSHPYVSPEESLKIFQNAREKAKFTKSVTRRLRYEIEQVVSTTPFIPTLGGGHVVPQRSTVLGL